MSKNINGIMGPQVGKIGTVVGYVANGKMIYRAYQRYVKNPQTPAQQAHRFKLKTLSQASKDLERMLKGNEGEQGTGTCPTTISGNFLYSNHRPNLERT